MHVEPKVIELLRNDPIRNANILGFINNCLMTSVDVYGQSVLVKGQSDKPWIYISSQSPEELRMLVQNLSSRDTCFAVIEDWMLPIVAGERSIKWTLVTMRLILPTAAHLPLGKAPVLTEKLGAEHAQYIYNNYSYQEYTDVTYITERLTNGPSAGVFDRGKLVAWALTHDDGAIGFLQVLDDYRGRGFALAVTRAIVEKVRNTGNIPFVHIEEDNTASMRLSKKMGFVPDRRVQWFELEDRIYSGNTRALA